MKKYYIGWMISLCMLVFSFAYIHVLKKNYVLYQWAVFKGTLGDYLHLYEADKLAIQMDAKFIPYGTTPLCATLSKYAEMKKKGLLKKYHLQLDDYTKTNLIKAVDIVKKDQNLVFMKINQNGNNVIVTNKIPSVDFSYLLE